MEAYVSCTSTADSWSARMTKLLVRLTYTVWPVRQIDATFLKFGQRTVNLADWPGSVRQRYAKQRQFDGLSVKPMAHLRQKRIVFAHTRGQPSGILSKLLLIVMRSLAHEL